MKKAYLIIFLLVTLLLTGCVFASNDTSLKVSANKNTVKMGDTVKFTATKNIQDNDAVVFKVNGKTITNNKNQSKIKPTNKKASITYTIPDGFRAGQAQITAVTNINNKRKESNIYINIEKMNTRFTNITIKRSLNSYNVYSVLLDDNNHTMSGSAKVAIKVNGKTLHKNNQTQYFKAKNGVLNATFKLDESFQKRNITVTLVTGDTYSYIGTRHEIKNLLDGSVEVKRMNTKFINTSIKRNNTKVSIYSLLVDNNNYTVKDTSKIAVKVNGKTLQKNNQTQYFYAVNGVLNVSFEINKKLSDKDINFTLVTGDTYSYIGVRKNFTSNIIRNTQMNISSNIALPYNNITIPVLVLYNNKTVNDGNISVYLGNKLIKTSEYNAKHKYIKLDSLDMGTYTLKIVYNSPNYKSSHKTIKVNIRNNIKTRTTKVASVFVRLYTPVNSTDVNKWIKSGITDVYVQASQLKNDTENLRKVIGLTKNTNIKVHAWLRVFNEDGTWIHTKTQQTKIKNYVSYVIKINGVEGVVLDYIRYSGTNPGTVNVSLITNFVRDVRNIIKSYNQGLELSACVFPEMAGTKKYYGQDYAALSDYLDFIMPMAYKYSYKQDTNWLKKVTEYVATRCTNAKEVTIIQTYVDEGLKQLLSVNELTTDIKAIMDSGSYGYALFYKKGIKEYPKIF